MKYYVKKLPNIRSKPYCRYFLW